MRIKADRTDNVARTLILRKVSSNPLKEIKTADYISRNFDFESEHVVLQDK